MPMARSAHTDTFARDNLPPQSQWPIFEWPIPELQYPERLNVAEVLLDQTAARFGADRIALRTPEGESWSYGQLQRRVNQVARLLTEDYGIVPGNRVLLRIPNTPWAVVAWFAAVKAGAIVMTTMVAWRRGEISKVAVKAKPTIVLVDHRFTEDLDGALEPEISVLQLGGPDDDVVGPSAAKPESFAAVDTAADDVVLFGPTSGTTGEPKITMHFHRDLLAIADTFGRNILQLQADDVSAGSPPLAFTFGLGGLVIFPFRFGGSALLIEKPAPLVLAAAIEDHGVTVLYTAPTGYRTILKEGLADKLRALRIAVSAGEHLPKETFEAVEKASGVRLINGIGATEMLHVFVSAAGDDIVPGATGKAIPGFRAMVLDDAGQEAETGQPGRLAVIGPTGCRYLADERQGDYVHNGWNITGDTYIRDENGYFFYQARSDNIIVAAGYNIGAPEVEAAIHTHPDVLECAVIGRPDPGKGAIVNAFVVLREGVDADDAARESIQAAVRAVVASYKIPRRIDFVDSLPHNPSGKIQHFLLRQKVAAEVAASHTKGSAQ